MQEHERTTNQRLWPAITSESRPWTRWWWFGSAVDEAGITRHLELLSEAGFGGVEISPIYGVADEQERWISFLSPRWLRLLQHTVREAERLRMGVDMICGTGWPLGGPWVSNEDAAARLLLESYTVSAGTPADAPIMSRTAPHAVLQSLMAFGDNGQAIELREYVDREHRLNWIAPAGEWKLYAIFQDGTGQQVKRAAPGGDGNVVDHFSAAAIARYLDHFDRSFASMPGAAQVRCFFNDSYEVYGANWTNDLLAQFELRRGYDLRRYVPALAGDDDSEIVSRVRSDYRHTIAELLLDHFVSPWTEWAHRHGAMTRNQAHGSPGNLLDLYAAADIPETETFGTDWLEIAGLSPLPGTLMRHGGRADILAGKLASSAAHLTGQQLCSSESFTWLGEHGQVPLAHMKAEVDLMFVMGINHLFFHGTPYSPSDVAWPGWLFYATTHVGPTNPFWRDVPTLNAYISRCQSFLQTGRPDNDLLLYFPIFDLWATDHGAEDLLQFLTPHNTEQWLHQGMPDLTMAGQWLWDQGYSFDCISDRLVAQAIHIEGRQLESHGGTYRALMVAGCTLMQPETLDRILDLARQGATVLVVGDLPSDVPGLSRLTERREHLRRLVSAIGSRESPADGILESRLGAGRVLIGSDIGLMLQHAGIRRESVVDTGCEMIRRRVGDDYLYFLTNLSRQSLDGWVSLSVPATSVLLHDPMNNRHGVADISVSDPGETHVYLQLEPGESILLRACAQSIDAPPWEYLSPAGQPVALDGDWHVEFIAGGPALHEPTVVTRLASWTEWPGDRDGLRAFSGTARYSMMFDLPGGPIDYWELDLGTVCHSARVRLNGHDLAALVAQPFRLIIPAHSLQHRNTLEIEVTNLMANRLVHLDRQGESWRKFFFVNMKYESFDAAQWDPLPSGLLGPVQLVPLRRTHARLIVDMACSQ